MKPICSHTHTKKLAHNGVGVVIQLVKPALKTSALHSEVSFAVQAPSFLISLPADVPGQPAGDSPSIATHRKTLMKLLNPGFGLPSPGYYGYLGSKLAD